MEYDNLVFELVLLGGAEDLCAEKYLLPLQSGRLSLPARLTLNDLCYLQAAACLREVEEANRSKLPGYELLVKGALLRFLALLIAQGKQQLPAETADTQRLKAVLQWLSAHYAEALRVADAAGVCSFSASHFMRWFRQMTGQSFIAFLNEYRLNAAAEALQTTDETILTIASRCGFEGLRPQAVGERASRQPEIFRVMARFAPSAPAGHRPPLAQAPPPPCRGSLPHRGRQAETRSVN